MQSSHIVLEKKAPYFAPQTTMWSWMFLATGIRLNYQAGPVGFEPTTSASLALYSLEGSARRSAALSVLRYGPDREAK